MIEQNIFQLREITRDWKKWEKKLAKLSSSKNDEDKILIESSGSLAEKRDS